MLNNTLTRTAAYEGLPIGHANVGSSALHIFEYLQLMLMGLFLGPRVTKDHYFVGTVSEVLQ